MYYKIEITGGQFNGYERYYKTLGTARRVAKTYLKKDCQKCIGCQTFADIYEIDKNYKTKLIETYDN